MISAIWAYSKSFCRSIVQRHPFVTLHRPFDTRSSGDHLQIKVHDHLVRCWYQDLGDNCCGWTGTHRRDHLVAQVPPASWVPICEDMVVIADCVGFYAAYHQSTEPHLKGVPVVALSNNDGCIIALSPEAKALRAVRCSAWYMVQEDHEAKGLKAFSSDHREYQAMNKRLMKIMARYVPRLETYSIDECWMYLGEWTISKRA